MCLLAALFGIVQYGGCLGRTNGERGEQINRQTDLKIDVEQEIEKSDREK